MNTVPSAPSATATAANADRSSEILQSLRAVFAEKGFDGASMQDLARAAGISVGNFYRYFPSKDAIIAGIAGQELAALEGDFSAIREAADPLPLIRAKIQDRMSEGCRENGLLWAEINAAAQRRPEIGKVSRNVEGVVARNLIEVFARYTGLGVEDFTTRFGARIRFIIMLVKTSAIRKAAYPDPEVDALALATIDAQISDIISAAKE